MAIQWTPWFNVPLHRRLEVLCVALSLFFVIPFGPLCIIIILVAGNIYLKIICALYLLFVWFDRHTRDRGGRGIGVVWFRNLKFWKYCMNYFPIKLVKTVDLPANQNYLICIFPHGLISFGTGANFGTNLAKWSQLFPGIRPKLTTLSGNFLVPIAREIQLSVGFCGASASSLNILLNQSNDPNDESNKDGYTSNGVGLIVGGMKEQSYTYPNTYRCFLKNRFGFVRIALMSGAPLVPAITFGENDVYRMSSPGPCQFRTFSGRGFLQYNYGLIPLRKPITTVIGSPIHVPKTLNATKEDIDKVHDEFCMRLKELFETHKSKYVDDFENVHLEIV